jgi:hypothetical protein
MNTPDSPLRTRHGRPSSFGWVLVERYPSGATCWEMPDGRRIGVGAHARTVTVPVERPTPATGHRNLINRWQSQLAQGRRIYGSLT